MTDNRQATNPLSQEAVQEKIDKFARLCVLAHALQGIIAVDGHDTVLVQHVTKAITNTTSQTLPSSGVPSKDQSPPPQLVVLPVTPWGQFVPALNALIAHALEPPTQQPQQQDATTVTSPADFILFASAETAATEQSIATLMQHMDRHTTLVVGARLTGHSHTTTTDTTASSSSDKEDGPGHYQVLELNGRTTPWNTLAVWNLSKLAVTGFVMVSEGLVAPPPSPSDGEETTNRQTTKYAGVEEVVTIALLQQLLGRDEARAKLVPVPGIAWDASFGGDAQRQAWHESKMQSKLTRAAIQLQLTNLTGQVHHYVPQTKQEE